jgi:hypothetical protein
MASEPQSVFNTAVMRGFFTGDTSSENISWSALTNNNYVINSNYIIDMSVSNCTDTIDLILNECNVNPVREPHVGDLVTIFWDGGAKYDCSCEYFDPTPTPTPTPSPTVSILENETLYFTSSGSSQSSYNCTGSTCTPVTLNNYQVDPCASPTPTPTPSATFCPTPTPSRACPPIPDPNCTVSFSSCYQMMTYRIVKVCQNTITLDRPTPNFACSTGGCYARALVYPPSMTTLYDSITPRPHWNDDVIDFESVCGIDAFSFSIAACTSGDCLLNGLSQSSILAILSSGKSTLYKVPVSGIPTNLFRSIDFAYLVASSHPNSGSVNCFKTVWG